MLIIFFCNHIRMDWNRENFFQTTSNYPILVFGKLNMDFSKLIHFTDWEMYKIIIFDRCLNRVKNDKNMQILIYPLSLPPLFKCTWRMNVHLSIVQWYNLGVMEEHSEGKKKMRAKYKSINYNPHLHCFFLHFQKVHMVPSCGNSSLPKNWCLHFLFSWSYLGQQTARENQTFYFF